MNLPDTGEIVTPVDDPCQFNPAWRAIVAGYLFSAGARTPDDFKSIAVSGCLVVAREFEDKTKDAAEQKPGEQKDGKKAKPKKVVRKVNVKVTPFYEHPEYRAFASDKWIQGHVAMVDEESGGSGLSDASVPFRLASRWYSEMDTEAALKKRLEPLLLTEIGMDVITLDLVGQPSAQPAVEAYERMYFNCRDDNFNRNPSMQLIQRIAMPYGPLKMFCHKWEELDSDGFVIGDGRPIAKDSDVWRAVAATMGYETLMYLWRWDSTAHGLKDRSISRMIEISWNVAVSRLMNDLYTGQIAHEDAARVLASYTAHAKMLVDSRRGGGSESNDTTKALMAVLYQTSPRMIAMDDSDDAVSSRNADIQSRISSQMAINRQTIDDNGPSVEHDVIDAQISERISGHG